MTQFSTIVVVGTADQRSKRYYDHVQIFSEDTAFYAKKISPPKLREGHGGRCFDHVMDADVITMPRFTNTEKQPEVHLKVRMIMDVVWGNHFYFQIGCQWYKFTDEHKWGQKAYCRIKNISVSRKAKALAFNARAEAEKVTV
jgi:hypothetical protein